MRVEQYTMLLIEMRANMLLSSHCYAENDVIVKLRNRVGGGKTEATYCYNFRLANLHGLTHMAIMFCSIEFCSVLLIS